jgi:hypothetical protein
MRKNQRMTASPDSRPGPERAMFRLVFGVHDIRIPTSDPWSSRNWYMSVLASASVLDLQEEAASAGDACRPGHSSRRQGCRQTSRGKRCSPFGTVTVEHLLSAEVEMP